MAHAERSINMSPLMIKNKLWNQRNGGNRYLVRLICPFLTLGAFSPVNKQVEFKVFFIIYWGLESDRGWKDSVQNICDNGRITNHKRLCDGQSAFWLFRMSLKMWKIILCILPINGAIRSHATFRTTAKRCIRTLSLPTFCTTSLVRKWWQTRWVRRNTWQHFLKLECQEKEQRTRRNKGGGTKNEKEQRTRRRMNEANSKIWSRDIFPRSASLILRNNPDLPRLRVRTWSIEPTLNTCLSLCFNYGKFQYFLCAEKTGQARWGHETLTVFSD